MAHEEITDDYVAKRLAKDAKETSIKYSALGQAFAPSKPPANKPKPNTRFLRNIIKDTDSHNAALLAREGAEARARLRSLPGNQEEEKKPVRVGAGDIRKRQLGDIAAILGGRPAKRRRTEASKRDSNSRYVNTSSEDERPEGKPQNSVQPRESREEKDEEECLKEHRSHHRKHRSVSDDQGRDRKERRKRDRSRSRSPRERRDKDSRRRHRSPRRRRSSSPVEDKFRDKAHRSHRHRRSRSRERRKTEKESKKSEKEPDPKPNYDSDPLDDIIGPRPPVSEIRTRGRGTISHASGIDARFSENYDPMADVQLDPDEENDWDQALEALRDRQKWKQQGADRLRAAGFTEDEISKWGKGGEKREVDVRWAKQGEGREWDRGKVFDDDGIVKVESSFGRLKDM